MKITLHTSELLDEGSGASASRLLPWSGGYLDPFILFDEYRIFPGENFPEHPHEGFQGFQVLREGRTIYRDMLGNSGSIGPGDVRRFVAGKGFRHSEDPDCDGTVRGFLLWVKIPRERKDTPSIFEETPVEKIPIRDDGDMKVIELIGAASPVRSFTPVVWELVETVDDAIYSNEMEDDENGFLYISMGSARTERLKAGPGDGFIAEGEGSLEVKLGKGTEMVFIKGKRLHEKIIKKGHFVLW